MNLLTQDQQYWAYQEALKTRGLQGQTCTFKDGSKGLVENISHVDRNGEIWYCIQRIVIKEGYTQLYRTLYSSAFKPKIKYRA